MAKPLFWNAINPFTGRPFTWGDPNLRWGSPSYYLEPGDPGFVPYPPQINTRHTRTMKQAYYPGKVADQIIWLGNFHTKLIGYIATLGLDASRAAGIIADCRWLIYVLGTWLPAVRA